MGTITKTLPRETGARPRSFFLENSVQYLPGVGPARAKQLAQLNINTVRDLVEHYPFRHELIPKSIPIGSLTEGVTATLVGTVHRVRGYGRHGDKTVYGELVDGTGTCRLRWFHCEHLLDRLKPGMILRVSGTTDVRAGLASLTNPAIEFVDPKEPLVNDHDRWEPVYSGNAQFSSKQLARLVEGVLDRAVREIADAVPEELRNRRRLPPLATAIMRYHRPSNATDVALSRKRLAYDELLLSQLALQLARKMRLERSTAPAISVDERLDQRIRKRIPFTLTKGQERAVAEIRKDLARTAPMNRLLQGDVGCGKTAVAVYAALAAIARGHQVALLAPTEVLARQHAGKIAEYLKGSRVCTGFLTGASATAERAATMSALQKSEISLLIGTHAVLEKGVQFANLGLAIIDEQQKFGVSQRFAMRAKAKSPHVLVLSATPIPRTLAMALLGDLDISTIDGLPPGRKTVRTQMVGPEKVDDAWKFIRSRLGRGEQAFVVYPLVEESESVDLKAATTEMEALRASHLSGFEVGLLHGRMKPAAKEEVMRRFRAGGLHALVSTIVIEVGVDVPNATIMVVQHADRFGLAQLHQLRGRVGRGAKDSHCLLFAGASRELPFARARHSERTEESAPPPLARGDQGGLKHASISDVALERLKIMCATNDGFRIAEEDLRLRGPGELLGTRQHGAPAFKVADLTRDAELIQQAKEDAAKILKDDPQLADPQHRRLRAALVAAYGETIRFIQVA